MRIVIIALATATVVLPASAQPDSLQAVQLGQARVDALGWMTGVWEAQHQQLPGTPLSWTDESWSSPRGGIMLGYGRRGVGPRLGMWEMMRIETDESGRTTLRVTGSDGQTAAFVLVRSQGREAVFENPQHDYPQRIGYRREGDRLTAWISYLDGRSERRWTFRPGPPRRR